jgi:SOS-response transcriptional repressor LexA
MYPLFHNYLLLEESFVMLVPVLGQVSAGKPIDPLPIIQWRKISPLRNGKANATYGAAQVVGDSLIDDGIRDGDYAIFEHTHEARNGDLVCALTPDGTMRISIKMNNEFSPTRTRNFVDGEQRILSLEHGILSS